MATFKLSKKRRAFYTEQLADACNELDHEDIIAAVAELGFGTVEQAWSMIQVEFKLTDLQLIGVAAALGALAAEQTKPADGPVFEVLE